MNEQSTGPVDVQALVDQPDHVELSFGEQIPSLVLDELGRKASVIEAAPEDAPPPGYFLWR